ncbi:hypothetical protein OROHE_014616 [Orobanche hederae]
MDKVHTRTFDKRVVIQMNEEGQPISDDDRVITELGSFLGTLRKSVSLTYKSWSDVPLILKDTMWKYVQWVLCGIRDSWRGSKSRLKKAHYTKYKTDEEMLANRPKHIPLEDFKLLLMYWGDNQVQNKAKTNSESRKSYTDTHTTGPKLFSQIRHKLPIPSDAAVFVKSRKRKDGVEYKTDTYIMKYRLEKIEKAMAATGGTDEVVQELVSDGKAHGPSWLLGRRVKSVKVSGNAPTSTYVQDLTTKIRKDLADEVEEKLDTKVQDEVDAKVNKKVQENLTLVFKKLSEANPGMKIDLGDLCATISTDYENGTPTTGGTSS